MHAKVVRPYSHSLSDDEKLYKTPEERAAEAKRDPIVRMAEFLKAEGLATEAELAAIVKEVEREVNEAAELAVKAEKPSPDTGDALRLFTRRRSVVGRRSRRRRSPKASRTRWSRRSTAR